MAAEHRGDGGALVSSSQIQAWCRMPTGTPTDSTPPRTAPGGGSRRRIGYRRRRCRRKRLRVVDGVRRARGVGEADAADALAADDAMTSFMRRPESVADAGTSWTLACSARFSRSHSAASARLSGWRASRRCACGAASSSSRSATEDGVGLVEHHRHQRGAQRAEGGAALVLQREEQRAELRARDDEQRLRLLKQLLGAVRRRLAGGSSAAVRAPARSCANSSVCRPSSYDGTTVRICRRRRPQPRDERQQVRERLADARLRVDRNALAGEDAPARRRLDRQRPRRAEAAEPSSRRAESGRLHRSAIDCASRRA